MISTSALLLLLGACSSSAATGIHQITGRSVPSSFALPNGIIDPTALSGSIAAASFKFSHTLIGKLGDVKTAILARDLEERASVISVPATDELANPQYTGTQQSNDISYYSQILIGTNGQGIDLLLDTGSADLWAMGPNCTGCKIVLLTVLKGTDPSLVLTGSQATPFDSTASSSFSTSGRRSNVAYGSATITGIVGTDTVSIVGNAIPNQQLIVVDSATGVANADAGGLFGLSFSILATGRALTPVENLMKAGVLASNMFSLFLTRNVVQGSTLTIGGVDSNRYTGSITYSPVVEYSYWTVNTTDIFVDGVSTNGGSFRTAVDSGTSLMYTPRSVAAALFATLPGARLSTQYSQQDADTYIYPCSSTAKVALSFGGSVNQYAIDAGDLNLGRSAFNSGYCVAALIGMDATSPYGFPVAIIGATFLKSWYSVYNYGATWPSTKRSAVGFAAADRKQVGCPSGYARDVSANSCVLATVTTTQAPVPTPTATPSCANGTTSNAQYQCTCLSPRFNDASGACRPACVAPLSYNSTQKACVCAAPRYVDVSGACSAPCLNGQYLNSRRDTCLCTARKVINSSGRCSPPCVNGFKADSTSANGCSCPSPNFVNADGKCRVPCTAGKQKLNAQGNRCINIAAQSETNEILAVRVTT